MNRSVQNEAAASLDAVIAFICFQKMVFVALSLVQESMIHLETGQVQSCMHAKISCWRHAKIRPRPFRNPPLSYSTSLFILS